MSSYYAELLPNIRSISLLVSLVDTAKADTRVTVAPAAAFATLHHNGLTTPLALPEAANPGPAPMTLTTRPGDSTLSSRLPLALSSVPVPADNHAPWSAPFLTTLQAAATFCCRACDETLVPMGCISTWKDLPSGNWADMMDIWHCHKPHEDAQKGAEGGKYAAFGKGFVVEQGTGLVDRGYFLFSRVDCESVAKVSDMLLRRVLMRFMLLLLFPRAVPVLLLPRSE